MSSGSIDQFVWVFSDGDTSTREQPAHYFQDSGWHYITVLTVSDSGCTNSYSDSLYKLPRFYAEYEFNDTCFGFESRFKKHLVHRSKFLYRHAFGIRLKNDTSYEFDLNKTFTNPGLYTVTLVMEQDNYCRDTFEQQVSIHALATADFSVDHLCANDSVLFADLTSFSDGTYERTWDFGGGITNSDSLTHHIYNSNGTKSVTLTIVTEDNCETDITQIL